MPPCPFHALVDAFAGSRPVTPNVEPPADELAFLNEAHLAPQAAARRAEIGRALAAGRPAPLTSAELTWAGRIAWRNHARCIGRLHWRSLQVRDHRELADPADLAASLREHLALAQGDGTVRSYLTVFAPEDAGAGAAPRIWNAQLCGYAGYRQTDGSLLGDPANEAFTRLAINLGWRPPAEPSAFDLLPWVISGRDGKPALFPLPAGLVREVRLRHPQLGWFESLGLRWYAVPVVSDMLLHAAGTRFPAAPFNGWYMGTEIGARNLADPHRYNLLPLIAERMGLDRRRARDLWLDRALIELNAAVLHSYEADGVKLTDHHTASEEFMRFLGRERDAGREVSARWDWIVPPISAAATRVFHTPMREFATTPDFRRQPPPAGRDG